MRRYDYIIIGNSAAGVGGCEGIRKVDRSGTIAMISNEVVLAYSRCLITHYISGHLPEGLLLFRPSDFYSRMNAEAILGSRAVRVDPRERIVELNDGSVVGYRKLLLATGAGAFPYDIPGNDKPGAHLLRTWDDARKVSEEAAPGEKALVLGGGLVGMKAADALHARGMDVTIIVASNQLLSQTMDRTGAEMVREAVERNGIKVLMNSSVQEITGDEWVSGVRLEDGTEIPGDMVIMAKGVRPNVTLAKNAGLAVDYGITVDRHMRTSDLNIYAAGDVAEAADLLDGGNHTHAIWPNAVEQGHIAGMNMAGKEVEYTGGMGMNSAEFFGLPAISMGKCRTRDEAGMEVLTSRDVEGGTYRKLVIRGNVLVGAVCVGDIACAGVLNGLIQRKADISGIKDLLMRKDFDIAKLPQPDAL
ncbi:NAD(P)/FAD-dependent oxidoreductase [Methanomassiliicoccus luminyensis]|uniref:NAD(P)/FAD-dependent oxidoreductase n=1 Tax=Methanomassiliicoccus luminyensis TaxID=1080712 RepID=UPI000474B946|nr:FAD-dependent oxidoreductase [Methanomassiliicoccus luminyensis]